MGFCTGGLLVAFAVMLQSMSRCISNRLRRRELVHREHAVVVIQSSIRRQLVRRNIRYQHSAILIIQGVSRDFLVRKKIRPADAALEPSFSADLNGDQIGTGSQSN